MPAAGRDAEWGHGAAVPSPETPPKCGKNAMQTHTATAVDTDLDIEAARLYAEAHHPISLLTASPSTA